MNISAEMAPVAKVFLHATFIMSLEESDLVVVESVPVMFQLVFS